VDSLLASLKSTLQAEATLTTLDNDGSLRFDICKPGHEEPADILRYNVTLVPVARKRYQVFGGRVYRWLEVEVYVWMDADWTDEEVLTGRGTKQGLDDICDLVEAELTHSTLGDNTLMVPTEDEGISEGEYVEGENESSGLVGVKYTYTQRRDISS